jgi:dUTP pyrophosphatase
MFKNIDSPDCLFKKVDCILQFAKCRDDAIIPSKRPNDAGFDLYGVLDNCNKYIIPPTQTLMIPTGLKSIIDEGYYVQIQERGSTGSKGIKYGAGVIDSNYRGEWFLAVTNCNPLPLVICSEKDMQKYIDVCYVVYPIEKAVFQGIVHKVPSTFIQEVDLSVIENNQTERGEGKLGSSNK